MTSKRRQIEDLRRRVHELEEILCPCEQHDPVFIEADTDFVDSFGLACQTTKRYVCRVCKKEIIKVMCG